MSGLLAQLGMAGASLAGGAALHGMGLGKLLEPLDYPRQALWNAVYKPYKALESGDLGELAGAVPGIAGALGGALIGGPAGLLAGSAIGGALQGVGKATGSESFEAPQVSDLTGTEDFLPNLLVGMATDPLTYTGFGGGGGAAKAAQGGRWGLEDAAALTRELGGKLPSAESGGAMQMAGKFGGGFRGADAPAGPFYSRLEEAIGKMPDSMKKDSVVNFLKKQGAPGEEMQATGLLNALEGMAPEGKVAKQDLVNWHGQNKLQLGEVMKGDAFATPEQAQEFEFLKNKRLAGQRLTPEESGRYSMLTGLQGEPVRYGEYQSQVPGNYKEMLLTLPENLLPAAEQSERAALLANWKELGPEEMHRLQELNQLAHKQSFTGGHWDEPNVLAHVRFKEGQSPQGERLLHLEEMQSDWHQKGREEGYIPREPTPQMQEREALRGRIDELSKQLDDMLSLPPRERYTDAARAAREPLMQQRAQLIEQANAINIGAVPDAPFKDSWHELALKRMLHHAATNDFERISFAPGEMIQQALGNKLTDYNFPGQVGFYGSMLPESELASALQGAIENTPYKELTRAQEGVQKYMTQGALGKVYPESELIPPEQYAAKLRDNAKLPNLLQKYAKKYGSQVEPIQLGGEPLLTEAEQAAAGGMPFFGDSGLADARQALSMRITPQLKEAALTRGFPLLSLAPLLAAGGGGALLAALGGQRQGM